MSRKLSTLARRRRALLQSDGHCYYCRAPLSEGLHARLATVDHKLPLSRGGTDSKANTVLACDVCNREKGDMTEAEFAVFRQKRRDNISRKKSLMLAVLECATGAK